MTTNEIRTRFLDFFKSKGHSIIASDSLVPKDDPTVLFTTAGMQQFKPQFLGHIDGFTRAATCQKCLRTDDLDVIGKTDFHHTFFEMLGNFSFGDYFKKEAIHWAWEFLTSELKLSKEKLWVSVYQEDTQAYGIWADEIKVPKERIVKLGDKSNFWPSNARLNGPNGPCGPCSEIFYDYGVNPNCPKGRACDPDCSCGRFSEVWNLVFTQFNRKEGGVLEPLPAKNIDTGMGLERLVAVVQGVKSNYETDIFVPIIKQIKEVPKISDTDARIVADHLRAVIFGIADGVIPSNEGRGYVIRKLIVNMSDIFFRAGIQEPLVHGFVPKVIEVMKKKYPEIDKENEIADIIYGVEKQHLKLEKEMIPELLEDLFALHSKYKGGVYYDDLANDLGEKMFQYYDTHGLSPEIIHKKVEESPLFVAIPYDKYQKALEKEKSLMEEQKNRSRAGSKMAGDVFANQDLALNLPKTEFLGYKETKAEAQVLKILSDQGETTEAKQGHKVDIILDRTPFYAEAGGQVGDSGYLVSANGKVRITDTQKANDIYVHSGTIEQGIIKAGDKVQAVIDEPRRWAIMRNHTATHLLQAALRQTLGTHIKQQGSLVEADRLRFDFTHPKGIRPEEMKKIENRLDEFIRRADPVTTEVLALEEARKKGALAFFAEKYGQTVRVVSIGDYSREFCGGTHVSTTSEIEAMKIVSEGSVAQGIRRLEAVTGKKTVDDFLNKKKQEESLKEQAQKAKQLDKEKQAATLQEIRASVDDIIAKSENINGVRVLEYYKPGMDIATLRNVSDLVKQKVPSVAMVLGTSGTTTISMIISASDDVVAKGFKANELISSIMPIIEGTGGGRPNMAQAGGKAVNKIRQALDKAKELITVSLRGTK